MDKYYCSALKKRERKDIEGAIDDFIAGLARGHVKCAFGLLRLICEMGSNTMGEEEAISIFSKVYPKIKEEAQAGDARSMFIVAEAVRLGFVEEEEPYGFYLCEAASMGDEEAKELQLLLEVEMLPWLAPEGSNISTEPPAREETDALLEKGARASGQASVGTKKRGVKNGKV